jgi:hypothetical protein
VTFTVLALRTLVEEYSAVAVLILGVENSASRHKSHCCRSMLNEGPGLLLLNLSGRHTAFSAV